MAAAVDVLTCSGVAGWIERNTKFFSGIGCLVHDLSLILTGWLPAAMREGLRLWRCTKVMAATRGVDMLLAPGTVVGLCCGQIAA
jgi:hypothetical protein